MGVFNKTVSDSVTVTESPVGNIVLQALMSETVTLSELLPVPPTTAKDTLTVSENLFGFTAKKGIASDTVSVVEHVTANSNVNDLLHITETLSIKHALPTQAVSDTLTITEVTNKLQQQNLNDSLSFVEVLSVTVTKAVSDILTISESLQTSGNVFNVSAVDNLTINEQTVGIIRVFGNTDFCQDNYNPGLSVRAITTLSYPIVSPTFSVDLRNPKFGNKQKLKTGREIRQTRGGDLIINDSPYWLNLTYFDLEFEKLNTAQAQELLALLDTSAADQIQMIDWEGRTWVGFIVSENNPVLVMMDDGCQYSAKFEFEGVLQ